MFLSGNTPFYVICLVVSLFTMTATYLVQLRSESKDMNQGIVSLSLMRSIIGAALLGSSLTSELFLSSALLAGSHWSSLGATILAGRLSNLPLALFLVWLLFHKNGDSGNDSPLMNKFKKQHFDYYSSVYAFLILLSCLDVSMFRFLPFMSSDFSLASQGYPTMLVFRCCTYFKILQSALTALCQIIFIAQVYASLGGAISTSSLAFVVINVVSTLLVVVLNSMEVITRAHTYKHIHILMLFSIRLRLPTGYFQIVDPFQRVRRALFDRLFCVFYDF